MREGLTAVLDLVNQAIPPPPAGPRPSQGHTPAPPAPMHDPPMQAAPSPAAEPEGEAEDEVDAEPEPEAGGWSRSSSETSSDGDEDMELVLPRLPALEQELRDTSG